MHNNNYVSNLIKFFFENPPHQVLKKKILENLTHGPECYQEAGVVQEQLYMNDETLFSSKFP